MRFHRYITGIVLLSLATSVSTAQESGTMGYSPQINGTVRARYEHDFSDGLQRFQVCNARVSLSGTIAPIFDHRLQIDLCDRGLIKMLDAWARVRFGPVRVTGGQFLLPFSPEAARAPHLQLFSEKGLVSRLVPSARGVGAKVGYYPSGVPVSLECSAFDPALIGDHSSWHKALAYVAQIRWDIGGHPQEPRSGDGGEGVRLATSYETTFQHDVRVNMVDCNALWTPSRWCVEGEYIYKHYVSGMLADEHAYSASGAWWMPIKAGIFNRLSYEGRCDGITRRECHGCDQNLTRLTLGSTISYVRHGARFDFRLNAAKAFHTAGYELAVGEGDMLTAEIVLRF